jgi:hypothetical protein
LKTLQGWYKCVCRALGREMFCWMIIAFILWQWTLYVCNLYCI